MKYKQTSEHKYCFLFKMTKMYLRPCIKPKTNQKKKKNRVRNMQESLTLV